jgi:hypothetical protein
MGTNGLKTNNDLFTEAEIDFPKTLGTLLFLEAKSVPDYQDIVVNEETGEVLLGALLDSSGQVMEGTVPEGVLTAIRSRPIEGTLNSTALLVESEGLGGPIEITVPPTVKVDSLVYNQEVQFTGLTARHWTGTTRQVFNNQVTYGHRHGFKLRAEAVNPVKISKAKAEKVE